jgi:HEAT repeat protein
MSMRPVVTSVFFALVLLPLLAGCGGKGGKKQGKRPLPPPLPPVPERQDMPVDPALQAMAKQEIMTAAGKNDRLIRAHAIEAMKDGIGEPAADAILKALNDDDALVRFAACLAAGELRLAKAREQALVLSDDRDSTVRIGARFLLHRLGDYRQSQDLGAYSKNFDPPAEYSASIRGNTALVLGLLGEPSARKILYPMLKDRDPTVRMQASEALWRLGDTEGRDNLIASTVSGYPDDQMIAVLALASTRDDRIKGHVQGALRSSPYDEVRLVAARAMGMLGSDEGYGVALKGAKSTDPRQRHLAALAFGAIGRTDAQPTLTPLLKDPNEDVRLAAATAILQLKTQ